MRISLARVCRATARLLTLASLCAAGGSVAAAPAPFDLAGPTLDVVVTRGSTFLPASEVPNLAEGDKLWIKPEFSKNQAANYLMVAVFLRGSTNPPPEEWFFPCKTWTGECARQGLTVTVPKGAQQMLVFLAPENNGDMKAVMDAVRGRPGAFVRASQDLNQAALDRSRLDRYLKFVNSLNGADPDVLRSAAPLLARSLSIKVDEQCLEKTPQLQAACLTAGQDSLILADGHSMTVTQALTNGPAADLVMAAASTPEAGYGIYSPYISSVLDIVRIFDSFRTAQYQYIPALAAQRGDKLALTLNAPPSFFSPKSVLVVAMPAIERAVPPPLRAVNPKDIYCASRSELVLPVIGAPLVYSTAFAHDVSLNLTAPGGKSINLRAQADPSRGGFVVNTTGLSSAALGGSVKGALRGYWGFETFEGPSFELRNAQSNAWALASGDENALIVGRQDTVHLKSSSVSCVDEIMLKDPGGKELRTEWKPVGPNEVEVTLPLQNVEPGALMLVIGQSGMKEPQTVPLKVFSNPGRIEGFTLHAGDTQGTLSGSRLDEVASLSIGDLLFSPGQLSSAQGKDTLTMLAQNPEAAAALTASPSVDVKVSLRDGRITSLIGSIDAPRPRVQLIAKSVQPSQSGAASHIQLSADGDEVPNDARFAFSLRALSPTSFSRDQSFEVATEDESFTTTLSVANGAVRLENKSVAVVAFNPSKTFGFSAFGPLKLRAIASGATGDWQALATLVRLPALKELNCPEDRRQACKLSGQDLFLIDAVASDADFTKVLQVPDGFPGAVLAVPQPAQDQLFVRLRDNPTVVNPVNLPVQRFGPKPEPEAPAEPVGSTGSEPSPAAAAPATSSGESAAAPTATASAATAAPQATPTPAPERAAAPAEGASP